MARMGVCVVSGLAALIGVCGGVGAGPLVGGVGTAGVMDPHVEGSADGWDGPGVRVIDALVWGRMGNLEAEGMRLAELLELTPAVQHPMVRSLAVTRIYWRPALDEARAAAAGDGRDLTAADTMIRGSFEVEAGVGAGAELGWELDEEWGGWGAWDEPWGGAGWGGGGLLGPGWETVSLLSRL